jgi:hypothetical protein
MGPRAIESIEGGLAMSKRALVRRALLGSVAEAMLRRARIGVLLYRSPRDPQDAEHNGTTR